MLDFLMISTRFGKRGQVEIYPSFIIKKSSDLMIRGGDFYAIWVEEKGLWSTDEQDAVQLIDKELDEYYEKNRAKFDGPVKVLHMWDAHTKMINEWHMYVQKQLRDQYHPLDKKIVFLNDKVQKKDYASNRLPYALEKCETPNYDKLIETLYDPDERTKIEWCIGAMITGASKSLQKFLVFYGPPKGGKSTIIDLMLKLFEGYYTVFDAKALGSSSNQFAMEALRSNPILAVQHDGDLSKIEDNHTINSIVSHDEMTINVKFKAAYKERIESFLVLGTNKPVRITDAKSGLIRRLIDVQPSGRKFPVEEYRSLVKGINFELGGIASHCKEVYLSDPDKYDDYVPLAMIGATNDFYNFVLDSYFIFKKEDSTTLTRAWAMYKEYCADANVLYPLPRRSFKEELKNYFKDYYDRFDSDDSGRTRSFYSGFRSEKFEQTKKEKTKVQIQTDYSKSWLDFNEQPSLFDIYCKDSFAQYANENETPSYKWEKIKTKLKDIDTHKLHYVKVPENHIVIDFDIPDENGNKCFKKNLEEANKWPKTYAELSKSGAGIHLHYLYSGDVSKLSRVFDEYIEIKIFNGNSSLRRKLTKCNDIEIASISSGLPLKGENKVVNFDSIKSEKALRTLIKRNLNKEIHPGTKPSVDFIFKILEDAYNSGLKFDVTDMRNPVLAFATNSTHQSDYCIKLVNKMHFKSEDPSENVKAKKNIIINWDVEVMPGRFGYAYKVMKDGPTDIKPIIVSNPTPQDVEELLEHNLIGFNNRRYDNHMMYARMMGYTNDEMFNLSQRITNDDKKAFFSEAYNLSYTDIYDYCSKKQSLKKWELELGITHHENKYPWDQPVSDEQWAEIMEYCADDVLAQEAVWFNTQGDFAARQIQVELVKSLHGITDVSVNDTTNSLSQKIIFGKNRAPQDSFNYRNLAEPVPYTEYKRYRELFGPDYKFRIFDENGLPIYKTYDGKEKLPAGYSILPFFPGYVYDSGRSTYLDQEIGEGGRVYAEPGIYNDIWDGDVSSMHPHSIIYECLFGKEYTKRFEDIVKARVAIKHKDFEAAGQMLNGVLKPYLKEETASALAQALKIVINSIYGLTSAKFTNAFRDSRNIDNIVAKRGALFMTLLKQEVQKRGYTVAHIKTDSIKIPNATKEIQDFVIKFGKEFGYSFETEAEFDRFCLVNDAVYVARDKSGEWTATGAQFQVPYVFKKLFSHEKILFKDMCELKSCKTALYLDFNEGLPEGEHNYHFIGKNGIFCPMKPGVGAGILYREQDGKYNSVTGTKGYLWMESDIVESLGKQDCIDEQYYIDLVNDAIDTINEFGDFEMFVADGCKDEGPDIKSDPLPEDWEKIKEKK